MALDFPTLAQCAFEDVLLDEEMDFFPVENVVVNFLYAEVLLSPRILIEHVVSEGPRPLHRVFDFMEVPYSGSLAIAPDDGFLFFCLELIPVFFVFEHSILRCLFRHQLAISSLSPTLLDSFEQTLLMSLG